MRNFAIALTVLAAGPALATPGGQIDTLQQGNYICELPGNAAGPAGLHQTEHDFTIVTASSYSAAQGRGTYLLTGDTVNFTSGPKQGQKFNRLSDNFLRQIGPDGQDGDLRCVRRVVNNR